MNEQVRDGDRRRHGSVTPQPDPCAELAGEWASALSVTGACRRRVPGAGRRPGFPGAGRRPAPAGRPRAGHHGGRSVPAAARRRDRRGAGRGERHRQRGARPHPDRHRPPAGPAGEAPGGTRVSAVLEALAGGYVRALVAYQRRHDPLTGLANRAQFLGNLAAALSAAPAQRIGVCSLDLDGFTPINDSLGYAVGDELLIAVARRLAVLAAGAAAGPAATLARTGGDEFALLVTDSGGTDALVALAREILARIEQPFTVSGHRLCITASIGIAERPAAGTTGPTWSATPGVRCTGRGPRDRGAGPSTTRPGRTVTPPTGADRLDAVRARCGPVQRGLPADRPAAVR